MVTFKWFDRIYLVKAPWRILRLSFLSILESLGSTLFGRAMVWLTTPLRGSRISSGFWRRATDFAQPLNPLATHGQLPSIQIVVVAEKKDFETLPLSLLGARRSVLNPISVIRLIVPDRDMNAAMRFSDWVTVESEDQVLGRALREAVAQNHPAGREGWILQQVLGIQAAKSSSDPGVVLLDADTILTAPRVFLNYSGRQLLCFSHEFEQRYEDHAALVWGRRRRHHNLSYVTHHQLMQPHLLREMFPDKAAVINWLELGDYSARSPISEYHSYGRWLVEHYPKKVAMGRWRNKTVESFKLPIDNPELALTQISKNYPGSLSVSLHSYLRESD